MATAVFCLLFSLSTALTLHLCRAGASCPSLTGSDEDSNGMRVRNARAAGEPASEFSCPTQWNREALQETIQYILKIEQKRFIRFRAPARNHADPPLDQSEGNSSLLTWVWVAGKFHYMLYYSQNFQTLSFGTTDVIAENTDEDEIVINCTGCSDGAPCGVGFFELKQAIEAEARSHDVDWEYLCLEADNRVLDIVSPYPPRQELAMLNTRNFALPDILYQSRFLSLFFSHCSFWSLACKKVPNYFCFSRHDGGCVVKELLSHYPKIIYLSVLFWLFSPLLVLYLPSSRPVYSVRHIPGMFPTHKVPVYLGRCIRDCLCYHTSLADPHSALLVRLRRALWFILLSALSFRFLLLPAYQPFSWIVFGLFFSAALLPRSLSVHISPEVPRSFPLFNIPYPAGMVRLRGSRAVSIEYQRLAFIMLERIFLPFDSKFLIYIFENSFENFNSFLSQPAPMFLPLWLCQVIFNATIGALTLSLSVIIVLVYFVVPLPYFAKELFLSISSGVYQHCHSIWTSHNRPAIANIFETLFSFLHGSTLCVLLLYLILTLFSFCFLLTEITIFTYLGTSIAANIVFHYFVLLLAFASAVYAIVHSIHKQYFNILKYAVLIMENHSEIDYIGTLIGRRRGMRLSLRKTAAAGVQLIGNGPHQYTEQLYQHRDLVGYMSTRLYFSIAESIQPIRRQIPLVFLKLFFMLFFIGLSMWTKNVYKNESIVSDIFSVAEKMAIPFIPAALQWFSSQGHFGRRGEAQQKIDIVHAVVDYAQKQSDSI